MNNYIAFTKDIVLEEKRDPITMDNFDEKSNTHPRTLITIKGTNSIPRPYMTTTINELVNRNLPDPFTRRPFTNLTKTRAKLYFKSLQKFPDYKIADLDPDKLFRKWISTYFPNCELKRDEIEDIRLEAECFLQAEDLTDLFLEYDGSGSMNNRKYAVDDMSRNSYATSNNVKWILRKCSVKDTDYDKAYAITRVVLGRIHHDLVIHKIGDGFYYKPVSIGRGDLADSAMNGYVSSHPTIIDVLKKFL